MGAVWWFVGAIAFASAAWQPALADEPIGRVKVVSGDVSVSRDGQEAPARPGIALHEGDVVETGENSAVGMTFTDDSRMSLGPESSLVLETYVFDRDARQDAFEARLERGTLTAASGRISKARPLSMRVLTPTTVLGVKGTEFALRVGQDE